MKVLSVVVVSILAVTSIAQIVPASPVLRELSRLFGSSWTTLSLGQAGECFVATDNQGHVYVTGHLYNGGPNGIFYASSDWGTSFPISRQFGTACCDFQTRVGPDGRVYVVYMNDSITGMRCAVSSNFGASFYQDKQILSGSYDREWFDLRGSQIDIVYSDGYIGGPTSIGVYYSTSINNGNTFTGKIRVDNEVTGTQAVDPSLICNNGTILAGWNTSTDSNTCAKVRVSRSTNGGISFQDHTTIGTFNGAIGDTQERWMAQIPMVAAPNNVFYVIFQNYAMVNVDGVNRKALLLYYRRSHDGGQTWEPEKTVAPLSDIKASIRNYEAHKVTTNAAIFPYYIQHEPWACIDLEGNVHVVWFDTRQGQNSTQNTKWQVYHAQCSSSTDVWNQPDPIAPAFVCVMPNLDFIGCAGDSQYVYCAWIQRISQTSTSWSFYGNMFLSRRPIHAYKKVP